MNSRLRTLSLRAMLALALILPAAAQAAPVTILSGQTMLFGIDMTGAIPAAPYTGIEANFGIDLATSDATLAQFQLFDGIDGTEVVSVVGTATVAGLATGIVNFNPIDGIVDGLFSFTVKALDGDLTMDAKVQGVLVTTRGELRTDFIEAVGHLVDSTSPGTVPEPSTAALVLLAAAAMAARGGRRAGHRRPAMQVTLAAPVPA